MAQTQRKKKRKKLQAKYIFRRFLLLIVTLALLGTAGCFFASRLELPFLQKEEAEQDGAGENSSQKEEDPGETQEPDPPGEPGEVEEDDPPEEPEPVLMAESGEWNLILVNFENPLPEGFEIRELEAVGYRDDGIPYQVDARIADAVKKMFAHAKGDGINLTVYSALRSVELQTANFNAKVQQLVDRGYSQEQALAETKAVIAEPGYSEHHTGLALDIVTPEYWSTHAELEVDFAETLAFAWLDEHAADYGFVLRFPEDKYERTRISYEPWHYRYVGVEHARSMKASGYCLEEYVHALDRAAQTAADNPGGEGEEPEDGQE